MGSSQISKLRDSCRPKPGTVTLWSGSLAVATTAGGAALTATWGAMVVVTTGALVRGARLICRAESVCVDSTPSSSSAITSSVYAAAPSALGAGKASVAWSKGAAVRIAWRANPPGPRNV